ncbi:MAG: cytochrome c family protein [Alphaproteobacteria bacterium]|nr:cytochrome c family protein [Alphaproteobacteria bacterium]
MKPTCLVILLLLACTPASIARAQDADAGEKLFERCVACHTVEQGGANRVGPNLWGVFGSAAGQRDTGFAASDALKKSGVVWTDETMSAYLERPRAFVPGTRMLFAGMKRADQRDDLIAYLKSVTR